jgi:hypothetical protein
VSGGLCMVQEVIRGSLHTFNVQMTMTLSAGFTVDGEINREWKKKTL